MSTQLQLVRPESLPECSATVPMARAPVSLELSTAAGAICVLAAGIRTPQPESSGHCGRPGWLDGWTDSQTARQRPTTWAMQWREKSLPFACGISSLPPSCLPGQGLLAALASPSAEKIRGSSPLLPLSFCRMAPSPVNVHVGTVHRMQEYPLLRIVALHRAFLEVQDTPRPGAGGRYLPLALPQGSTEGS